MSCTIPHHLFLPKSESLDDSFGIVLKLTVEGLFHRPHHTYKKSNTESD